MKKNYIWYALGAIAIFYVLKKKGIIGESIEDEAMQLTAEEVNNLKFKIDYDNYEKQYRQEQEHPEYSQQKMNNAEVCN